MGAQEVRDMVKRLETLSSQAGAGRPNPGAKHEDIAALEAHTGVTLSEDYRAFLEATNGWANVAEHLEFLSVEQITGDAFDEINEELRGEAEDLGFETCWLIGVVLEEDTGFVLLRRDKVASFAEMHMGEAGEVGTFEALLGEQLEMLQELVEEP